MTEMTIREALEEIRDADPVDLALDPEWPQRIARAALSQEPRGEEWPRIPIRFARPQGETFAKMQEHIRNSPLYQIGDAMLVWVNEGDFLLNPVKDLSSPPRPIAPHKGGETPHPNPP